MDFGYQKNIFLKVVNHIQDLNEFLMNNNCSVDKREVANNLDNKIFNLDTDNMNIYLASLLKFIFNQRKEIIKIKNDDANKFIVINFINTVLEEFNIKQIEFEVA